MNIFVIDVSLCKGCYACQIACKDEHVDNDWHPYARPQPETGQFWLQVQEKVRGTIPKVMMSFVPKLCMHCDEAPCMRDCPEEAIYKRKDGLVIIDSDKCTGCGVCLETCPHDAVFFNHDLEIAQKCTGCAHLLDHDDDWDIPRCVDACPNEAIRFGEESELRDLAKGAEQLHPEFGTRSRVYYMGLPKKFVAGTLYDPVEEEVVIDALCTLTDKSNHEILTVKTDHFGDFWFHGLKESRAFSLRIEKDGKVREFHEISTDRDVNLGDIPLYICE